MKAEKDKFEVEFKMLEKKSTETEGRNMRLHEGWEREKRGLES